MQADTYQLKQVMTPERRYVIPTFQRDYEWTREGQWELLFEDLDAVAQRLGEARAYAQVTGTPVAKAEKEVAPHFLGAVVCDQLPSPAGGLDLRAVIDGQQRLTTLQLVTRGLLDVLIESDSSRVRQVRRLLENPTDVVQAAHERHKLWPRRKDRLVWPQAMADEIPSDADESHLYIQARRFFADAIRTASSTASGADRMDDLVDSLLDMFKLVVIDLEDNDDAQVIFEVLNGRQTPLTASDLVKNLLFLRGELKDEHELEKLYDTYWADFDEAWWKQQVGTGHAARGRRDILLSVWLTAASGVEASVGHLYGEVRQYLSRENRSTEDILKELSSYGAAYKAIYGEMPVESELLRVSYQRLDKLKIQTALPLLAWLRTLPTGILSVGEHESIVSAVESWVVRRMLLGANTRGYNTAFMTMLRSAQRAYEGGRAIFDAVSETLLQGPNSLGWPTDNEVEKAFLNDRFYDRFTQERIRLVLGAIDVRMREENAKTEPAKFNYDGLQIEHIMPKKWRDHWPVDGILDDAEMALAENDRDAAVHRIGNLTLVTSTFNQGVSNSPWSAKRPELATQSGLQLNVSISAHESWNELTIAQRGSDLAHVACRVWARPKVTD